MTRKLLPYYGSALLLLSVWFFAVLAAFSLSLVFGLPTYRIIFSLPGINQLHSPFRWLFPYTLCVAVLAGMGARRRGQGKPSFTLVNANKRARKLLETLGLGHFFDIRPSKDCSSSHANDSHYIQAEDPGISRHDHVLHMIEAHRDLIDLDNRNRVRFENVMKFLGESLDRAGD